MAEAAAARVRELELEVARLMEEADRYRTAAADTLEQVDWCSGYFTAQKQHAIARSLSANRAYIQSKLLHRDEQPLPQPDASSADRGGRHR